METPIRHMFDQPLIDTGNKDWNGFITVASVIVLGTLWLDVVFAFVAAWRSSPSYRGRLRSGSTSRRKHEVAFLLILAGIALVIVNSKRMNMPSALDALKKNWTLNKHTE